MSYLSFTARIKLVNVLLATDFSEASMAAVGHAAAIAGHYHGTVLAVHVIPPEAYHFVLPSDSVPAIDKVVEKWTEQQMNALLSCRQLEGVPHSGIIKHGEIWDALAQVVDEHHIDVIIAATRGRRGFKKLIMGSVAEEIFRLSPIPVLTIPPDVVGGVLPQLSTILYPTDFSLDSVRALAYVLSLAQEFQSSVIFLYVAPGRGEDPENRKRLARFFEQRLRELVPQEVTSWCHPHFVVDFGDPAEAILKTGEAYKVDLIIMGVRGAGALTRASTHLGSTAYRVVSEARAPVLSVRQLQQDIFR